MHRWLQTRQNIAQEKFKITIAYKMTQQSMDLCGHDNLNSQQWLKSKYDMYIPQVEGKLENEWLMQGKEM